MERRYVSHYRNSEKNCFPTQNCTEIGQLAAELWSKTIFKWRPSAILNFKKFLIWSRDCRRVLILHLFTKFYQNRVIFLLKYGDFTIFKMRISVILSFMGPIMGSLKTPCRSLL